VALPLQSTLPVDDGSALVVRRMKFVPIFTVILFLCGCVPVPEMRCLVSPLRGTVVSGGIPAVGATVTRKYYSGWYDQHVETVTHTDAKGVFEFHGAWKASAVYLVHQPAIQEEINVSYEGKTQTVLHLIKMDYDRFGELSAIGGDQLSVKNGSLYLVCDLSNVPITKLVEPQNQPKSP
jgi:hypothetical protein